MRNTPQRPTPQRLTTRLAVWTATACWAASTPAWAQEPSAPPLWEIGALALGVSQQSYPGSDQNLRRVVALPTFIYRGQVLRADRGSLGIRALKTPTLELDVGVSGAFGSSSAASSARQGMPNLGTLIELGPRLKWQLGSAPGGGRWRAEFPVRAVFDLSDGAAHRGWSFEPELAYERRAQGGWRYTTSLGLIVADQALAATFYQVTPEQATATRPAYAASSGLMGWRLGTTFSRSLNPDWRVFGFARIDSVSGSANQNSPLVRQNTGASVGLGVAYTWMRSNERASD